MAGFLDNLWSKPGLLPTVMISGVEIPTQNPNNHVHIHTPLSRNLGALSNSKCSRHGFVYIRATNV